MPILNQQSFNFDAPPRVAVTDRSEKMQAAYDASGDEWKDLAYKFAVRDFLPAGILFIFQDLTRSYEEYAKRHNFPVPEEKRAYAGLQQRLLKEKLMRKIPGRFERSYEGNSSTPITKKANS